MALPARIAIDLGAESCRVSLLRWLDNKPRITLVHRFANGPMRKGPFLYWPLDAILAGIEEGLRKAAEQAPEGIASIAADSWSVDYVRLAPDGSPLTNPFCYRDERTTPTKASADQLITPRDLFARTGAQPLRINTVYQLLADPADGVDANAPWVMLPEYILYWLSGRRVAEYSNASHTGLVSLATGNWDTELFTLLGLPIEAAPPIVKAGTILGPLIGPLASLPAFRQTQIVAPATHDTASAIAGIPSSLDSTLYICSGTWSLVGTLVDKPVTSKEAFDARSTNLGSASSQFLCHTLVNGMWILKKCMDEWAAEGRSWEIEELVTQAARTSFPGTINVDAEPLLLDAEMPEKINHQLWRRRWATIPDVAGNEPVFARVIFESLAARYALALGNLENMLGQRIQRVHILGGASRNQLLTDLTEQRTGRPVEIGHPESSTIGNLAVQLAATEANGTPLDPAAVRRWAALLCDPEQQATL